MRAVFALLGCAAVLSGCSVIEGMVDGQRTRDPSTIYIASFHQFDTTREGVDQFACLSGAPVVCDVVGVTLIECECPY